MIAFFVRPPITERAVEGCADRARVLEAYEQTHLEAKVSGFLLGAIAGALLGAIAPALLMRGR